MFILDETVLEPGDILLSSEKSVVSKTVRKFTNSDFSHAMLYVGNGSYIHSDQKGVHANNIQRSLFHLQKNIKILRVKKNNCVAKACEFSRTQIGKEYALKDAIKTKNPIVNKSANNKQFCSRLVAQAYEYAGLQLVGDSGFCTPQELDDSEHTFTIENGLREATEKEIEFSETESPLEKQTKITNSILKNVRTLTGQDIQTLTEISLFMEANPEYDQEITEIFVSSGYLVMWQHERNANEWRYEGEKFLKIPVSRGELINRAKTELSSAHDRLALYKNNLEQFYYMKEVTKLEYASIHFELYKNLVEQTLDNINAAEFVIECT